MRTIALALFVLFAACKAPPPLTTTPSFQTSPTLAARNPADIAVLPVEDGTATRAATPYLADMRQVLLRQLPQRRYSPLAARAVDAAVYDLRPGAGETVLTPSYLKRVAGRSSEDALLAVRVDEWNENRLMSERVVGFQFSAVLVGTDGERLWNGTLRGEAKAGGLGAAPRDRDGMARSCAELALKELLNHLALRTP